MIPPIWLNAGTGPAFIDYQAHQYWNYACQKSEAPDESLYQELIEKVYRFADEYIGSYLHFLDEGWTEIHVPKYPL